MLVSPPELIKYYKMDETGYPHPVMDPRRLNGLHLKEFRKILGEYGYAGQFLQDPVPLSGGTFDITKMKIEEAAPAQFVRLVRGWDKAATKDAGAYSCGVLIGLDRQGDYWILDVVRGQWTPRDREAMIMQTAQMDAAGAHGRLWDHDSRAPVAVEIIIEKEGGSGGVESSDNSIRNLVGFRVLGKRVTGKKEERAYYYASQVGVQDHVHVLNNPTWTKEYLQELRFFPHSKFKDQVDASSLAFNRIARQKRRIGAGALSDNRRKMYEPAAAA